MKLNFTVAVTASALLCGACTSEADALDDRAEENPAYYGDTEKGGETYSEYDQRRDQLDGSAGTFGDYGCTEDCSGHEAGYEWAEAHGIEDADECGGKSWSFEEGCREYAEEQQSYLGEDEDLSGY